MLPAPVLFLYQGQIWQLSSDARSTAQITNENDPITAFDVSPVTDQLVYVSRNQLILSQIDGSQRKILRQGIKLHTYSDLLDQLNDEEWIQNNINSPMFSSDGKKILFIENGLKRINIEDQTLEAIWKNHKDLDTVLYRLLSISPDDKKFLVSTFEFPLDSIYQVSTGLINDEKLVTLMNQPFDGYTWFADGKGLILSDSRFAQPDSLLQCELDGYQCKSIAEFEPGQWYYAYSTSTVVNEQVINVFMGAVSDPTKSPELFKVVQLSLDGRNRTSLMEGEFPVEFGLWSNNGHGVIIQLSNQMQLHPAGSVLWLDLVQKKILELPITQITQMKWGWEDSH